MRGNGTLLQLNASVIALLGVLARAIQTGSMTHHSDKTMRLRTIGLGIVLCLLALGHVTAAQIFPTPLVMLVSGDLWAWDGTNAPPRPLTTWGYNDQPSLSPDGTKVAYTSLPQMVVDVLQREGGVAGGALPSNVWVLDLTNGKGTRLADQPPGASFFTEGTPDLGVARSKPVWSPDGSQIAWTEMTYPADTNSLVVYDFATSSAQTVVADFPPQYGVPVPMEVQWGQTGLLVWSDEYDQQTTRDTLTALVYDPSGTPIRAIPIAQTQQRFSINHILLTDDGKEYVGIEYNTGEWELVDPLTGVSQPAPASPQLISTVASISSIRLQPTPPGADQHDWQIIGADGNPAAQLSTVSYASADTIAISPDGAQVAYLSATEGGNTQVSVWRRGFASPVPAPPVDTPNYSALVWGQQGWNVTVGTTPAATSIACAGTLPPRLTVGGQGRVLPDTPNNLRTSPSVTAARSGQIPVGGTFTITAGPECRDGIVWWAVDYGTLSGWTAESQGEAYFVEPVG